jgi:hypothetical protein
MQTDKFSHSVDTQPTSSQNTNQTVNKSLNQEPIAQVDFPSPLPMVTEPKPHPTSEEINSRFWVSLFQNWQRYIIMFVLSSGAIFVPVAIKRPNLILSPKSCLQQYVSRTDYELLRLGMTLTDAQATLGRAIETSRDSTSATYRWNNRDGSGITAVFKENRLVSKNQIGFN